MFKYIVTRSIFWVESRRRYYKVETKTLFLIFTIITLQSWYHLIWCSRLIQTSILLHTWVLLIYFWLWPQQWHIEWIDHAQWKMHICIVKVTFCYKSTISSMRKTCIYVACSDYLFQKFWYSFDFFVGDSKILTH